MSYIYTPYILPLIAAALVSAFVAFYAWTRRATAGALPLALMAAVIFEWVVAYSFEITGATLEIKYFWGVIQYFGIAFVSYSVLLFSLSYSGYQKRLTRRFVLLTALVPAVTVLLALTTKQHGLIWSEYHISRFGSFSALGVSYGAWFWVHFTYSYLALLVGAILLLRDLFSRKGLYRGQAVAMFIGVLAPWIGNALYLSGNSPIPYLDLTPFAFTVSAAALAWAIFGFRLIDLSPVARDLIVEGLREGLIVLDMKGKIVDINAAAARMIGVPSKQAIGKPAVEILEPWLPQVETLRNTLNATQVVEIGTGEARRKMGVRISPLRDERNALLGRIISFWELSETFEAEQPTFRIDEPLTQPLSDAAAFSLPEPRIQNSVLRAINDFFAPPFILIESRLLISPLWARTIERVFTIVMRIMALLGSIAFVIAFNVFSAAESSVAIIIGIGVALAWGLGLVRKISYGLRVTVFALVLYAIAFNELLGYGYSPESFAFFLMLIVFSVALAGLTSGLWMFGVSLTTIAVFGVLISARIYQPLYVDAESIMPYSFARFASAFVAFSAVASGLVTAVNTLLNSLNASWQKEAQALSLAQQERDLLEQRVKERTAELSDATDSAVRSAAELRKYYLAIEQSGNSILITDTDGNIEYANPKFEEVTGYALEEALGKTPRILKSNQQSPEFYKKLWDTISSGQVWYGVFHNRKKDGTLYWESATIAPVLNQDGKVVNYVAVKEDITEQRILRDQLQKQNDYLSILHQITLDMLNRRQRGELLQTIAERAAILLDAPIGELLLEENGALLVEAFTENAAATKGEKVQRGESPLSWQAFDEKTPIVLEDYSAWEKRLTDIYGGVRLYAVAEIPILAGERCLGILSLSRTEPNNPFTSEQIQTGILFARVAALALDNANLYNSLVRELEESARVQVELKANEQEQRALSSLLQLGMKDESVETTLDSALDELLSIDWLGLEAKGGIFLTHADKNSLKLTAQRNLSSEICALCAQVKFGHCLCGRAAQTQQIQFSSHVDDLHEVKYEAMPDHGHYNIPILSGSETLGVIVLYLPPAYLYSEVNARFLKSFADSLSNILRRKRIEALLRDSEARFRQIVENASDLIYRTDAQGNFIYVNPTSLAVMGYKSESEVLGKNFVELAALEWKHKIKRFYDHQYLSKEKNTYFEFPAVSASGETVWFGQSVQLVEEDGVVTGFQAVARDITRLKQAQEALAISRDQALEANRAKGQLLSRVSHELRTPLGGILGFAELLQIKAFGEMNEKQEHAVVNIIASTNYLTSVVNDLLDEAQMESQSLLLNNEYFSPAELIENVKLTISVLASKKGLALETEISPDLPAELYGDAKRLQQIIINLAGNAVKFTKAGGIAVKLRRPRPAHWSIEVSDTGAGIPKSEYERIFEPFRQVNNSITRENRGSGLGLAIAKQLVEIMGGQIHLESEVGKGSLFVITLPIMQAKGE
ncbi:MAG: hypothetical protein Fur002_19720 [Anaerolineales bacterium]